MAIGGRTPYVGAGSDVPVFVDACDNTLTAKAFVLESERSCINKI